MGAKILQSGQLLSIGNRGNEVSKIQYFLNFAPPSRLPDLVCDGIFGPRTDARVREFQRKCSLRADGIVGPLTVDELCTSLEEWEALASQYSEIIRSSTPDLRRIGSYQLSMQRLMVEVAREQGEALDKTAGRSSSLGITLGGAGPRPVAAAQGVVVVGILLAILIAFYIAMLNLLPSTRKAHQDFAKKVDQEINRLRQALNLPKPLQVMQRVIESVKRMVNDFIETLSRNRNDCNDSPADRARCAKELRDVATAEENLRHKVQQLIFVGIRGFQLDRIIKGILFSSGELVKAYAALGSCLNCDRIKFL